MSVPHLHRSVRSGWIEARKLPAALNRQYRQLEGVMGTADLERRFATIGARVKLVRVPEMIAVAERRP